MLDFPAWPGLTVSIVSVIDVTIRVVALFVVPRNRNPSSGTAWLLFIFFFPIVGLIAFLVFGANRMPKTRRGKHDYVVSRMQQVAQGDKKQFGSDLNSLPPGLENAERLALSLGAQPMLTGNTASITYNYEQSIANMARAIRGAKSQVSIEFYIFSYDQTTEDVFEAMREASDRGVIVRVMLDHIAMARQPKLYETTSKFDEVGARWAFMLPIRPWKGEWRRPDLRNHRKLMVIDGTIGFVGSQNLVDSSYNKKANLRRGLKWQDIMVEVTGPVVSSLNRVFMGDWYIETGEVLDDIKPRALGPSRHGESFDCQILPSGPGFGDENNLQVFIALIGIAKKRISITSPYFVPDQAIMYALRAATARGVKVELFVSETGDQAMVYHAQRSYYEALLRAGVRIFMFKSPYILHAKHFSIDDHTAVVGSSNMDQRSFNLNMEVSMIVTGKDFAAELDRVNDYYRANSRELTAQEWKKQPLRSQLLDGLCRLTSALQ